MTYPGDGPADKPPTDGPGLPPTGYPQQSYPSPPSYPSYPPPASSYPSAPYSSPGYPQQGGYPPSPYTQQPGYPVPPPNSGTNGMAIGSLVVGLVSLPLFFLCFTSLLSGIVAIVLGVVAINQLKTSPQSGKGMAIAGIASGTLAIVISLAFLAIGIAVNAT